MKQKIFQKLSMLLVFTMMFGIIQTGNVYAKPKYREIRPFKNGFAITIKELNKGDSYEYHGLIDRKGKVVLKPTYENYF